MNIKNKTKCELEHEGKICKLRPDKQIAIKKVCH